MSAEEMKEEAQESATVEYVTVLIGEQHRPGPGKSS